MKPVLLTDFGSTYTKLTAVDVDTARVLGTAAAYTTVQTDVNDGFSAALRQLEEKTGRLEYAERYACSSADDRIGPCAGADAGGRAHGQPRRRSKADRTILV